MKYINQNLNMKKQFLKVLFLQYNINNYFIIISINIF